MSTLRHVLLASSALAFATAASAADTSAPMASWTGVYAGVGVGGGYAFSDTSASGGGNYFDYSYDAQDYNDAVSNHVSGIFNCDAAYCEGTTGSAAGLSSDQGQAGFLLRGEIGADYQFDRIVAGVNASFTFADRQMDAKGGGAGDGSYREDDGAAVDGGGTGTVKTKTNLGNNWTLGARLGYLMTDSTLLFASGGYTQASAEIKSRFQGVSTAGIDDSAGIAAAYDISSRNDEWLGGYYLGAGLETMMMDHLSLKLEYRYADYGSIKSSSGESFEECTQNEGCWGYDAGVKSKADLTDHSVMATLSFRM